MAIPSPQLAVGGAEKRRDSLGHERPRGGGRRGERGEIVLTLSEGADEKDVEEGEEDDGEDDHR